MFFILRQNKTSEYIIYHLSIDHLSIDHLSPLHVTCRCCEPSAGEAARRFLFSLKDLHPSTTRPAAPKTLQQILSQSKGLLLVIEDICIAILTVVESN